MDRTNIKVPGIAKVEVKLPCGQVLGFEDVVIERWPEFPHWVDIRSAKLPKDDEGHYLLLAMVPEGSTIRVLARQAVELPGAAVDVTATLAGASQCRHGCYSGGCGAPGCSCDASCPCQQHTGGPDLRHD